MSALGGHFEQNKSGVECCSNEGNSLSLRRQILMTNIFNMKKRITLLFAAALSMSTLAFAQPEPGTFSITPRIGLSMSNLLDDNAQGLFFAYYQPYSGYILENDWGVHESVRTMSLSEVKYRVGFTGAVDLQWHRSERWAFVTGLGYSMQGCRFEHDYQRPTLANPQKKCAWDVKDVRINLHYLSVPVMAKMYLGHGLALNGGVQVGWLLRAYEKHHLDYVLGMSGDYYIFSSGRYHSYKNIEAGKLYGYDVEGKMNDYYHRVNIEIPVGFSYENGPYVGDLRANIGTNDIADYGDAKVRNISFVFSLGYRFDFKIR